MSARENLLRAPPPEFLQLLDFMHEDAIYEVTADRGVTSYLTDCVYAKSVKPILTYLDALLARGDVDSADLKGLLQKIAVYSPAREARQLLESLQEKLNIKAETNA